MGKWFSRRASDLSLDRYWANLTAGSMTCRVTWRDTVLYQTVLRCEADLVMPVMMDELGETGQLSLHAAVYDFFLSRAPRASVQVDVCKTIEKWGQPIQFRHSVTVELWKTGA